MLTLTKKTDYALVALSHLAARPGDLSSARSIASNSGVPLPVLTNILKLLAHAGVVESERGANGGYRLAKSPDAISVDTIITAIEGPLQLVQCIAGPESHGSGKCDLERSCPVRHPAQRIHDRLKRFLQSVPLSELVATDSEAPDHRCAAELVSLH